MTPRPTLEEIIEAAKKLPLAERERLLRALAQCPDEPLHEITELRGLGKEVWGNIDAQEYIDAERDAWED